MMLSSWNTTHEERSFNDILHQLYIVLKTLTDLPLCRIYASVNRVNIGSGNGLAPIRRQAIIYINAELVSIGALRTNFNEILIKVQFFHSLKHIWIFRLRNGRHFVQVGD